jgi:hypothetical protein
VYCDNVRPAKAEMWMRSASYRPKPQKASENSCKCDGLFHSPAGRCLFHGPVGRCFFHGPAGHSAAKKLERGGCKRLRLEINTNLFKFVQKANALHSKARGRGQNGWP